MEVINNIVLKTLDYRFDSKPVKKQIIDDGVISIFRRIFNEPDNYLKYLEVLWKLRDMVYTQIEGIKHPEQNGLYPAFEVLNEIIGILISSDVGFRLFTEKTGA